MGQQSCWLEICRNDGRKQQDWTKGYHNNNFAGTAKDFLRPSKPSFQTVTHRVCLGSVLVCLEHGNPEPSTSGWGQEITHTVTCLLHFLLPPISFTPHNIPL